MAKGRPIALDISHFLSRLHISSPTGIDRVDLNYAKHLTSISNASALRFWLGCPITLSLEAVEALIDSVKYSEDNVGNDEVYSDLLAWLQRDPTGKTYSEMTRLSKSAEGTARYLRRAHQYIRTAVPHGAPRNIPSGAVYLSVTQDGICKYATMRWLRSRPDVKPVFFVHDLLPLDYPEYFPAGYWKSFDKFIRTTMRFAAGFIVSSETIAGRLRDEMRQRGKPEVPIHVAPLPPSAHFLTRPADNPMLQRSPYFVICGTLEPRKNHLLLLNIWQSFASHCIDDRPRLIVIGKRGWENEQTVDMLERCSSIRGHVVEVAGLTDIALRQILANANGVLFPSFNEGYGLPMVEALSLRTPVIASDIPVCHEVTQGCAIYKNPLDGPGWITSIKALSRRHSPTWREAHLRTLQYRPPEWEQHISAVSQFLESI
jgi:glycosyltransferase involved in cell wall biosynthesis